MAAEPRAIYLRRDLEPLLARSDLLAWAQQAQGEEVRRVASRRTLRLELGGRTYYLKAHEGVGLREVLKSWLSLKQPVVGARNEFAACRHLREHGILAPRVAAFGEARGSPHGRFSFLLSDALEDYTDLETLSRGWSSAAPSSLELRALVMQVAAFTRELHAAGVAHRDFYICHLLRSNAAPGAALAVLDLHRALIFESLPRRWRRRDLAALLYSVMDLPLGKRAWLRFVRVYSGQPLRRTFAREARFWRGVHERALKLHAKGARKGLNAP